MRCCWQIFPPTKDELSCSPQPLKSRRHVRALVDLTPLETELWNTINQRSFYQIFRMSSHLAQTSSSCVWAAVQTKSTRSSSHVVLLMLRDRRSSRRFGGGRMLQSKMIWLADCSSAPQMHLGVSRMPQRYRHVPKRPTPVLNLFSATQGRM